MTKFLKITGTIGMILTIVFIIFGVNIENQWRKDNPIIIVTRNGSFRIPEMPEIFDRWIEFRYDEKVVRIPVDNILSIERVVK